MLKNAISQKKNRNKKILICETRDLSYGSSGFFLKQIRMELERQGVQTDYFKLQEDQSNLNALEQYLGRSFDAVLDINSYLPRMILDDGTYWLDHIQAPFVNYIVDHPLHLHPLLNSGARNHYVLCLDRVHQQYIQTCYPAISGCFVLPLAASVPECCKTYSDRSWHIYFPGTYVPLTQYEMKLRQLDPSLLTMIQEYDKQILTGKPMPDMVSWYQTQQDYAVSAEEYYIHCRYMDRYLREITRHRVLEAVLAEGYSIHVTGAYWEHYDGKYRSQLILHPSCDYPAMLSQIGNSQILLNVQPSFPNAPHDRILCGMAGGAVVLTDSCSFLEKNLVQGQQYLGYDSCRPQYSMHKLRNLLQHTKRLDGIAAEGSRIVRERYLWCHWVSRFLDDILGRLIDKKSVTR